jgi:hypothetical protein
MSVRIATPGPHLEEGALVRLVDREVSDTERAQIVAHVERCSQCAGEWRAIVGRSRALVELLERTDPGPRIFALTVHRRPSRTPLRSWPAAAAVVLLVVGVVAFSASPIRAWIIERWADGRRLIGIRGHSGHVQSLGPTRQETAGGVSFTPASDVLIVRLATRQAGGTLLVEATDALQVSAEVDGASVGGELLVLPNELRIANAAQARASYRVAVPTQLKEVIVLIGGEPPAIIAPGLAGERRTLDLSGTGARAHPGKPR